MATQRFGDRVETGVSPSLTCGFCAAMMCRNQELLGNSWAGVESEPVVHAIRAVSSLRESLRQTVGANPECENIARTSSAAMTVDVLAEHVAGVIWSSGWNRRVPPHCLSSSPTADMQQRANVVPVTGEKGAATESVSAAM